MHLMPGPLLLLLVPQSRASALGHVRPADPHFHPLYSCRHHEFRAVAGEGALPVSVRPVCVDTHGERQCIDLQQHQPCPLPSFLENALSDPAVQTWQLSAAPLLQPGVHQRQLTVIEGHCKLLICLFASPTNRFCWWCSSPPPSSCPTSLTASSGSCCPARSLSSTTSPPTSQVTALQDMTTLEMHIRCSL